MEKKRGKVLPLQLIIFSLKTNTGYAFLVDNAKKALILSVLGV